VIEPVICRKCSTPRLSSAGYCVTCGTQFPKDVKDVKDVQASASAATAPAGGDDAGLPSSPVEAEERPPTRRRGLIAVASGLVVALVLGAIVLFTGGKGGSSAYALQFSKASPGDTYRYHMTMDMDLAMKAPDLGLDVPIKGFTDMLIIFEVISKDGDAATVELSTAGGTVETNGTTQPVPDFKATMKIASDGRVLDINGTAIGGNASLGSGLNGLGQLTPLLPTSTVKPGDTWSKETEVPFLFGDPVTLTSQNRFEHYETIRGERAAVIRSEIRSPFDNDLDFAAISAFLGTQGALPLSVRGHIEGTADSTSTSWVDLTTGRWFKTLSSGLVDLTMTISGFPAEAGVSQAIFEMTGTMDISMETAD
jgi:hypothetical protein